MSLGSPVLMNWYCNCKGTPTCPEGALKLVTTSARADAMADSISIDAARAEKQAGVFMSAYILPVLGDILKVPTFEKLHLLLLALQRAEQSPRLARAHLTIDFFLGDLGRLQLLPALLTG